MAEYFSSQRNNMRGTAAALSKTADVTVSQDGSGKFKRIMDAIAAAPSHSQKQFVIFVKKGVYKEYVKIDKTKTRRAPSA
ncbi:putative pectinesterase/pectinesterase inhibitor 44 [Prunus yedoensis var. nudiflora]|uniref:Pectinesterase n=1 Tax=Prunus yedoensis var. nudiflora TaxID=2094558 RepID=A0A314Y1R7_PRUYE|nr:putative pectinesterase/pectinesterase inhibitor 44 [Prunus yedoensis var. nudiflora]